MSADIRRFLNNCPSVRLEFVTHVPIRSKLCHEYCLDMTSRGLRILDVSSGPSNPAYEARLRDWEEDGDHLQKLCDEYEDSYRKKICSKCTQEQKIKRKCIEIEVDGRALTYCNHMNYAKCRKFRKEIRHNVESHPALFTIMTIQKSRNSVDPGISRAAAP